jgi:hypothetical protein
MPMVQELERAGVKVTLDPGGMGARAKCPDHPRNMLMIDRLYGKFVNLECTSGNPECSWWNRISDAADAAVNSQRPQSASPAMASTADNGNKPIRFEELLQLTRDGAVSEVAWPSDGDPDEELPELDELLELSHLTSNQRKQFDEAFDKSLDYSPVPTDGQLKERACCLKRMGRRRKLPRAHRIGRSNSTHL